MSKMKTVLQVDEDHDSEVIVFLDTWEKKIGTQIHIKPCLVYVPTTEAERYQHTFVPPEFLHKVEMFPGLFLTVNVALRPDALYLEHGADDWTLGVF